MPIPDVSREKIEDALRAFDDRERTQWLDWENNRQHNYAILWQNRYYPVKQIIRMATGDEDFWGGRESNDYLSSRGFTVIRLDPVRETDQRFRAALERIQQARNLPDLQATADYLMQHEWREIQSRLEIFPELKEALCAASLDLSVIQTLAQNEIVGGHTSVRAQVKDFFDSENAVSLIKELIGDCRRPPSAEVIDRFVEAAVKAGFQDKSGSLARSNAALFASMLLTAVYPNHFVDFRQNRWVNLADLLALEAAPSGANYGELLCWAGRIAGELARTPTFNRNFSGEYPIWIVAGLAWLFQQEGEIRSLVLQENSGKSVNEAMKIWKISAGEGGKHWSEFKQRGLVAISFAGYFEGNLGQFTTQEEIYEATNSERYAPHRSYAAQQLWMFYGEMKEGDLIFVYGNNEIKGKGTIAGPYQFQADDSLPYPHRRAVKWNDEFSPIHRSNLSSDALRKKLIKQETIVRLTKEEAQEIIATGQQGLHPTFNPSTALMGYFQNEGYHFSPTLLATFITALQTKGFVILSGLSGTGKTKLAELLAELLPKPIASPGNIEDVSEEQVISIVVKPSMLERGYFLIPKPFWPLIDVPDPGDKTYISVQFNGKSEECRYAHHSYPATDYLILSLKGDARKYFSENYAENDVMILDPLKNEDGEFTGFVLTKSQPKRHQKTTYNLNHHFVAVRPDWRDSKSLLGYYNPLTNAYADTPFLRFLLRTQRHYDQYRAEALPHVIILDEMNLARVEYYFVDFLSVLESRRNEYGYTKEALRLHSQDAEQTFGAQGVGIPQSLQIPPNLYIIGTVNMDETTHAFSPKVLDRAFTIEFNDVDFSNYPTLNPPSPDDVDRLALQRYLLDGFQRDGRFAQIDKDQIAAFVQEHLEYRHQLEVLKQLLVGYELHFGYRVFDEIMQFMVVAQVGDLFDTLDSAFDQAVLMKVLPKFNGPRGRLSEPLQQVIGWAKEPHTPLPDSLKQTLLSATSCRQLLNGLETEDFQYIETARKALRMLIRLHETGFASFA